MSSGRLPLVELPWLPRTAPTLRADLRALEQSAGADWGPRLQRLAGQYLGLNQAIALAQAAARLRAAHGKPKGLASFRLGVVANSTLDFVGPMLAASALRHGVDLEVIAADFGQAMQEAADPASKLNRARPDAVLLALDHRGLPFRSGNAFPPFDAAAAAAGLGEIAAAFRRNSGAPCLVQTLPAPPEPLFGSLDRATRGTLRAELAAFNDRVAGDAAARGDVLVDVDWLVQSIGADEWFDDRQWYVARLACSMRALPAYADLVGRTLAAIRGKARKCLVLDLDNTLWGGVIGDDGLDGIALQPGDARGEAHRAIQQAAADLRARGIVLAVCSKNDDATARQPFRSHDGMILRESDIAVFVANWDDKATNLERIARQLDIGIDSLVLLDDNPAERAQVRGALPQVAVPEVGDDPSQYVRLLLAAGYFESVTFTAEDLARADQYAGNAQRAQALEGSRNLDEFLLSLQQEIVFAPFAAQGRKRITQLINKTNQFNVATRRYTEQQVAALEGSPAHYTLQCSVRDRFGDNGMIGVVICAIDGTTWHVDSWLMSCRVLNRGVEQAVCNRLVEDARRAGAHRILGTYVPTDRNGMVRDLFPRLGFERDADDGSGVERWSLTVDAYVPHRVFATERLADGAAERPAEAAAT
jgi:FkbH-like protein